MKTKFTSKVLTLPTDEHEPDTKKQKRIKLANTSQPQKKFISESSQKTSTAGYLFSTIKSLFTDDSSVPKTKTRTTDRLKEINRQAAPSTTDTPLVLDLSDPGQIISFIKSRSKKGITIDPSTMLKIISNVDSIYELNKQYERTIKSLEKDHLSRSKMKLKTIQHPSARKSFCEKTMLFNGALREQLILETKRKLQNKEETTLTKSDLEQLQSKITFNIERETQNIAENINKVQDKIAVLLENNLKNNFEEIISPRKQPLRKSDDFKIQNSDKKDFSYEMDSQKNVNDVETFKQPEEGDRKRVKSMFKFEQPEEEDKKKVTFKEDKKEVKNMFSFGKQDENKEDKKEVKNMFSFGKQDENKEDKKEVKNMFSLGKPDENKEDKKEVKNMFSFGKPDENKEDKKEVKNMFSFGSSKPTTPVFSFGPDKGATTAPTFSFGPSKPSGADKQDTSTPFDKANDPLYKSQGSVFNFNSPSTIAGGIPKTPIFNFGTTPDNQSNQSAPVFDFNQPKPTPPIDMFSGGHRDYNQNVDLFSNTQPNEDNNGQNSGTFSLGQLNSSDSVNKRRIFKARRN